MCDCARKSYDTRTRFWLDNINNLFYSSSLLPNSRMSLEEKMNTMTRLVVLGFIICLVAGYKYDIHLLFFGIIFIILIYYSKKNMVRENFTPEFTKYTNPPRKPSNDHRGNSMKPNYTIFREDIKGVCNDDVVRRRLENPGDTLNLSSPNYESLNKSITGNNQLSQFEKPPIIVTPAVSEVWREGGLSAPSQINKQSSFDLLNSGYYASVDKTPRQTITNNCPPGRPINGVGGNELPYKVPVRGFKPIKKVSVSINGDNSIGSGGDKSASKMVEKEEEYPDEYIVPPKKPISVTNLPTNLRAGECPQMKSLSNYNDNLFTQNVGVDSYAKTTYVEPANGRIGISEPLHQPVMETDKNMTYILDPSITKPPSHKPQVANDIDQSEIYDPRMTSYGDNKRSYVEPMTGQVRWYYDDVNAQNQYYVTRNKLDFTDFGQSAGPMGNNTECLDDIKKQAQNHFIDATSQQREGLSQSFMQEYNTKIGWQRRQAPIITMGGGREAGGAGI